MSRIKWSAKRSADDKFDFLLGHVGGKLFFTANPQRFGAEGAEASYDLHSFIAGTYEEAVVRNQLEARAEQILDQAIRLLTGAASNRAGMSAEEIAREAAAEVWRADYEQGNVNEVITPIVLRAITTALAAKDAEPKISGSETPLTREHASQETGKALRWSRAIIAEHMEIMGYTKSPLSGLWIRSKDAIRAIDEALRQSPDEPRPSGSRVEAKPESASPAQEKPVEWARCKHCGGLEMVGSDDCRNCGINFSEENRQPVEASTKDFIHAQVKRNDWLIRHKIVGPAMEAELTKWNEEAAAALATASAPPAAAQETSD